MKQEKYVDEYGNIEYYKDDQLHRDNDLPAVEHTDGGKFWYQNGKKHRDNDLPASEYPDGRKYWIQNGKIHRLAGPSIMYPDGFELYYINDIQLTKEQHANHPEVKKYKLQQILNRVLEEQMQ